jgi:hypothetical protein
MSYLSGIGRFRLSKRRRRFRPVLRLPPLLNFHIGANLVAIDQFTTLGRGITLFDHARDFGAVLYKPFFLFVEHPEGAFHEFIGGLVDASLRVSLNEGFDLGTYVNGHN